MNLEFIDIKLKNFLSFGNIEQKLELNKAKYTTITGINKDVSSDDLGNRNGCGKAQPLYSTVLTENGFKKMSELQIGMNVITPKGLKSKIIGIYDHKSKDVYRVYFSDNRYTDCCNEHLWKVIINGVEDVINLEKIIQYKKNGKKIYVPLLNGVNLSKDESIIDPYIVGKIISNGIIENNNITIKSRCSYLNKNYEKFNLIKLNNNEYKVKDEYYNLYYEELKSNILCNNEYKLSEKYKQLSDEGLKKLIMGIIDEKSYISDNRLLYSTKNEELAKDLQEIIYRIGGICRIDKKDEYILSIIYKNPEQLITNKEKIKLLREKVSEYNEIIYIEYLGKLDCRCIYIDDEEHLYITDNYIVTHNTTLYNAIHYALFGHAIGNKINLPNLINNINKKNLEVKLTFKKDDAVYRIERGRNPTYLKIFKGDDEIFDETLGDSRDTQKYIEQITGLNEDLFNQTIMLSCNVPIFMDQTLSNQKLIIEKVLGIDVISEKIDSLKNHIKDIKNEISNESFKIQVIQNQNNSLKETYTKELNSSIENEKAWNKDYSNKLIEYNNKISMLNKIDFNYEEEQINSYNEYLKKINELNDNKKKKEELENNKNKLIIELNNINNEILELSKIDIDNEIHNFKENENIKIEKEKYNEKIIEKSKLKEKYNELLNAKTLLNSEKSKIINQINNLKNQICPTCGQIIQNKNMEEKINLLNNDNKKYQDALETINNNIVSIQNKLNEYPEDGKKFQLNKTYYKTIDMAYNHSSKLDKLNLIKKNNEEKINEYNVLINSINIDTISKKDKPSFSSIEELYQKKNELNFIQNSLNDLKNSSNPYTNNIKKWKDMLKTIIEPDESNYLSLLNEQEHNDTLLKLLNSPQSFVRTTILNKSLEYLNKKIRYYLSKLGSTIQVKFNSDMSIDMIRNGLEFGYVSSGEMGRISFALTLAFRDTWENLSGIHTNLLMIDEQLDKLGLDINGKQAIVNCIKNISNKNIFLVSHDTDITDQSSNIIIIEKEKDFSSIKTYNKKEI